MQKDPAHIMLWIGLFCAVSFGAASCRRVCTGHTDEELRITAADDLTDIISCTELVLLKTGKYAPTDGPEYCALVVKYSPHILEGGIEVCPKTGAFVDPWRRAIVMVVDRDSLVGLGSSGPNGVWEDGKSDDIMVPLAKNGVPVGPAGSHVNWDKLNWGYGVRL